MTLTKGPSANGNGGFSPEVPHWHGLGLKDVDCQEWALFMTTEELGMEGPKLTLSIDE